MTGYRYANVVRGVNSKFIATAAPRAALGPLSRSSLSPTIPVAATPLRGGRGVAGAAQTTVRKDSRDGEAGKGRRDRGTGRGRH